MKKKYGILGAGNGGQSISAYLKLKGNEVYLYDRYQSMIDPIKERGGIELTGVSLNGTAKLDKITTDIEEAIKGVDFICSSSIKCSRLCRRSFSPYTRK